jgi:hypothetical protein
LRERLECGRVWFLYEWLTERGRATAHAEFLYASVEQTLDQDLPEEIRILSSFDAFRQRSKT